jgi:hypothetical protein
MGLAVSLFVFAAGAIVAFAVNVRSTTVNVPAIGYILMAVGVLGALLWVVMWERVFGDPRQRRPAPPQRRAYPPYPPDEAPTRRF